MGGEERGEEIRELMAINETMWVKVFMKPASTAY